MVTKNQQVIDEFRANNGVVLVTPPHGPILLLHSKGAKTGRELVTPLIYRPEGDSFVVLASMGGWKTNPAWYYNLVANPNASIEVGTRTLDVTAVVATGPERQRLFELHCAAYKQFAFYQGKTTRVIPVIVLHPRGV